MFISMLHLNVLWHKLKCDQREKFPRKAIVHFDIYCTSDFLPYKPKKAIEVS